MKTFLKIVGAILALFIVVIIGLNIYFTNERLQSTIMPYVNDAVGRTVEVESMSLTIFSTFPQPGLSIEKMSIPGETQQDTLLALDELVASVELFSLMGDQIEVSQISLRNPQFTYVVHSDGSTNIDFLMTSEATATDTSAADTTASAGFAVNIPSFQISGGDFGYTDSTANTTAQLNSLDANIALRYADLIESTIDLQVGGISAKVEDTNYLNGLALDLNQQSTIDMKNENLMLDKGTLSIRGLALNLSGTISDWSKSLNADLAFNSSSDDFGELLRLVPKSYEEYIQGLKTEGSLAIDGTLKGPLAGDKLPRFDVSTKVQDGYLKNPDLPKPIENIQLDASASNDLVTISKLNAEAGENTLSASGELQNPLESSGNFSLDIDSDVNLSTINNFYDISQFDIEQLDGQLSVNGTANGNTSNPEEANFDAAISLSNGGLTYADVNKPIENITIDAQASQSKIDINKLAMEAASNTISIQGDINQPLKEEQRSIDLTANLQFDLGTVKDFYPISEDTMRLDGMFTANATLKGKATQIENAVQSGSISLTNGFIEHKTLAKPLQDITLQSDLSGSTISISKASFRTGNNGMSASGTISNYLSDNKTVDLRLEGQADLSQITEYYDLNPTITKLTGNADLNLRASGAPGDPANMQFNGKLTANGINMQGEALTQPVKNLNGKLTLSPAKVSLDALNFNLGSSDISLNGSLNDYMAYLKAEKDRDTTPHLTGSYKSKLLNVDELINWEDTTTTSNEPVPIHLPDLTSSVTAEISKLVITEVTMKNLEAKASTTPKQIKLNSASVQLFGGQANGSLIWNIPQPDRTNLSFNGSLDGMQVNTFFEEYQVLGENSKFHEYVSGNFSANVNYATELDDMLLPVMKTSTMDGDMSMANARLQEHPLQNKLAVLFNSNELKNVELDDFKSTYTLKDNIFTIKNLRLTSGDIGMQMDGTQHMVTGKIDYHMKAYLPGRFQSAIGSVISDRAAKALKQEDGTIMVPLRVTGTQDNPKIRPDQEAIKPIIKEFLKDKAGNTLKKLFDG
ncbi:AsmA-like C-terminal region [Fodinibius salinus]|uniref:AsmA-like C-terminal region n=1 Tax=Fodinibius salinus TaxID=860790 RepID=A0A5D3YI95_9BACT|nr:AsmA-like C-terminal region-containing protein [Fodinibius salinus]TYP91960.1 AsmA-like C-terminal region [Fodinibius salinus]